VQSINLEKMSRVYLILLLILTLMFGYVKMTAW